MQLSLDKTNDPRAQLALFFQAGFKSNGEAWERKLYKTLWARVRRLDAAFRRKEAARMRMTSQLPGFKEADARRHAAWYRDNLARVSSYNANYHREHRRRHCHFCGQPAPKGRYGLRRVSREVLIGGKFVARRVLWCGCFGDPLENFERRRRRYGKSKLPRPPRRTKAA